MMAFNDYWKMPKDAKKFFSPKQEKMLKEKYGKLYTLHTVISIVILLVPFIAFLFFVPPNAFESTTQTGNICGAVGGILAIVGSFVLGIGFVNIFASLIKQYLGHYVTLFAIIIGAILDGSALFIFSFVQ